MKVQVKRETWGEVLERVVRGASRTHMEMTFSRKIGCLSTVAGGQKKNMGTNMGILTDVEGVLVCCFLGQINQDHKQRGLGGEVIVFRTMRMCIPQEV